MTLNEFQVMLLAACSTKDFTAFDGFLGSQNPYTAEELQNFCKEIFIHLKTIEEKDSAYQSIRDFAKTLLEEIKKNTSIPETKAAAPKESPTSFAESESMPFQGLAFEQSLSDLMAHFKIIPLKKQVKEIESIDSFQKDAVLVVCRIFSKTIETLFLEFKKPTGPSIDREELLSRSHQVLNTLFDHDFFNSCKDFYESANGFLSAAIASASPNMAYLQKYYTKIKNHRVFSETHQKTSTHIHPFLSEKLNPEAFMFLSVAELYPQVFFSKLYDDVMNLAMEFLSHDGALLDICEEMTLAALALKLKEAHVLNEPNKENEYELYFGVFSAALWNLISTPERSPVKIDQHNLERLISIINDDQKISSQEKFSRLGRLYESDLEIENHINRFFNQISKHTKSNLVRDDFQQLLILFYYNLSSMLPLIQFALPILDAVVNTLQLEKNSDSELEDEESLKQDKKKKSRSNKKNHKKKKTAPKNGAQKKDAELKPKKVMGYADLRSFKNIAPPVPTTVLARESEHYQKIAQGELYFQEAFSIPEDLIEFLEDEKSDIENSIVETNQSDLEQNASQASSTREVVQEATSKQSFDLKHVTFGDFKTPIEPSLLTFIKHEKALVNVDFTPPETSKRVEIQSLSNSQVTESQNAQVNSEPARPTQSIRASMQVSQKCHHNKPQKKNLSLPPPIQLDPELLQSRQKMDEIERDATKFYATGDTPIDKVMELHGKSVELTTDLARTSAEYEHPNKPAIQNFQHAMISLRSFSRRMGIERLISLMNMRVLSQASSIERRFEDEKSIVRQLLRAGTVALKKALNIAANRIDQAKDASEVSDVDELLETTPTSPGQMPYTTFAAQTLSYFTFLYKETLSDGLTSIASVTQEDIRAVEIKYNRLKAGIR